MSDLQGQVESHRLVDVSGMKEIGNLASWTVSTAKPGCGVEALRTEDSSSFWQSDGPQPHLLNIHFSRMVSIAHIRMYLDFAADESYTPTKLSLAAGTGHHDLQEFAELAFEQPQGWIDVDLTGVGGTADGASSDEDDDGSTHPDENILRAHLVQITIKENHQNGKDTHIRGLQVFAPSDENLARRRQRQLQGAHHDKGQKAAASPGRRRQKTATPAHEKVRRRLNDFTVDDWGFLDEVEPDIQLR